MKKKILFNFVVEHWLTAPELIYNMFRIPNFDNGQVEDERWVCGRTEVAKRGRVSLNLSCLSGTTERRPMSAYGIAHLFGPVTLEICLHLGRPSD